MHVIVGIASAGRGTVVRQTLSHTLSLRDRPDAIWVCLPEDDDGPDGPAIFGPDVTVIRGPRGSCPQRNSIIEAVPDDTIILFLDDDFLLGDGSITAIRDLLSTNADIAMATGKVLADGIGGPGLNHDEGTLILDRAGQAGGTQVDPVYNAYGCNMVVRVDTARRHGIRFDTDLPMYGWLEDVDFSRRMASHGRIVKFDGLFGVHLGTKKGRSRGVPLGYSQIANPVHLIRNGTITRRKAYRLMTRNVCANLGKMLWPEPWIDRKGRLMGNLTAFADGLRGRLTPTRVRDL
ncbi:glycosyltransferase family 2 protein [Jannaschia sp. 2305UL9-9]|uniref:glycosyltransferase family 2 protein n=1 Tax=Jannaschia sp. 2305UL9-9 TaxID=3121638 RepID=UPI0035272F03